MNPENLDSLENGQTLQVGQSPRSEGTAQESTQPEPQPIQPKRSYKQREKKTPTIAALNEQIQKKKLQQEAIQADIDDLTAKRNALFVAESELLGLLEILADPESAMWLAKKVEESSVKRNQ